MSTGTFSQTGGTNSVGNLFVGAECETVGSYSLSGSGLLSAQNGNETIGGYFGTGTLTQSGGTNCVGNLRLGDGTPGGVGSYILSSGVLMAQNGCEYVGVSGMSTGSFTQTGGTNRVGNLYIDAYYLGGSGGAGVASYSLSGSGWLGGSSEFVGYSCTGSFTQSGGTNSVSSLSLGYYSGSSGTYGLNSGVLVAAQISGGTGTSVFNFNGGTLQAASGGTLMSGLSAAYAQAGGVNIDTNGQNVTISQSLLDGGGGLTKLGSGNLSLTGSNTYSGPTTVNQGGLVVDGSLLSPVTVNSGGTLGGTGSLSSGTVNSGGHIAPGDSQGVLQFGGNLMLLAGASMDYELDMPGSGDELQVGGLATLNGTLNVGLSSGFTPSAGQSFDLINGTKTGSFSQINLPTLDNGLQWNTSNLYSTGTISVTPEPSTLALLAAGAIGLAGYAWRRRRKRCLPIAGEPTRSGQEQGPAVLTFPSRWATSARRAA